VGVKGKISSWNDERGFGFITPDGGGERVFVHAKALKHRGRRPEAGDAVTYVLGADQRGRPRAERVAVANGGGSRVAKGPRKAGAYFLAGAFLAIVGAAVWSSALPPLVLAVYLAVSVVTFAAYALDKSAARRGGWRTAESRLHLLALLGGWPGALVAQATLRHKSRKQPFRTVFWGTVVLNGAFFVWLFTPRAQDLLRLANAAVQPLLH
jgi:uncharacterized membrane protein YsdA (DUF1294 family)/cold shock CspA family protein